MREFLDLLTRGSIIRGLTGLEVWRGTGKSEAVLPVLCLRGLHTVACAKRYYRMVVFGCWCDSTVVPSTGMVCLTSLEVYDVVPIK